MAGRDSGLRGEPAEPVVASESYVWDLASVWRPNEFDEPVTLRAFGNMDKV